MDIYVLIVVPNVSKWDLETVELQQTPKLLELGVEPLAYRWNNHISLEARPITREITDILRRENDPSNWKCFVLKGDFLYKIEEDVNGWVDEWDVEYPALLELLEQTFDVQDKALFAFERNSETIDSVYTDKTSGWINEKVRSVLNRSDKFEGFVVTKGLVL
jgi:hypothetical protein